MNAPYKTLKMELLIRNKKYKKISFELLFKSIKSQKQIEYVSLKHKEKVQAKQIAM